MYKKCKTFHLKVLRKSVIFHCLEYEDKPCLCIENYFENHYL